MRLRSWWPLRLVVLAILLSAGFLVPQERDDDLYAIRKNFEIFGTAHVLTWELIRVAVFLSGFAALYFTVYLTTDATFREEFFEDTVAEVRQAFAVRAAYLEVIKGTE